MEIAEWSFEVPPAGAASEGVQDYEIRSADARHVGVGVDVLRKDDGTFLLVDAGAMPPLVHRWVAVRWQDVAEIDHELLTVTLGLRSEELGARAVAVDPARAVRGAGAAAARLTGFDAPLFERARPAPVHAVSEPRLALPVAALAVAAVYSAFVVITVWIGHGIGSWEYALLAIPAGLAALAVALEGYRLYREPHVRALPAARAAGRDRKATA